MSISVYSLASAILFFSTGLMLIKLLRCRTAFLVRTHISVLWAVFLLSLLRLLLPLNTKDLIVLQSEKMLPFVLARIDFVHGFTVGTIICGIWAFGFLLSAGWALRKLRCEMRQMNGYRPMEHTELQKRAERLLRGQAEVVVTRDVDVPKVIGIKRVRIYLPPLQLTDAELQCVVLHELQHVKGKDLYFKLFYLLLKALLWWNPVIYFFHKELENLLELRCDAAMIRNMSEKGKITYLESILKVMKQVTSLHPATSAATLVNIKSKSFVQQRFEVILHQKKTCKKRQSVRFLCITAILFLCSYCVMVKPTASVIDLVAGGTENVLVTTAGELERQMELCRRNDFEGTLVVKSNNSTYYVGFGKEK